MQINLVLAATFVVSLAVWLGISFANGGGEAWDTDSYWSIGLPAVYLAGGVAGVLTRTNVWKIALWSGLGQLVGLILGASGWSLCPWA